MKITEHWLFTCQTVILSVEELGNFFVSKQILYPHTFLNCPFCKFFLFIFLILLSATVKTKSQLTTNNEVTYSNNPILSHQCTNVKRKSYPIMIKKKNKMVLQLRFRISIVRKVYRSSGSNTQWNVGMYVLCSGTSKKEKTT